MPSPRKTPAIIVESPEMWAHRRQTRRRMTILDNGGHIYPEHISLTARRLTAIHADSYRKHRHVWKQDENVRNDHMDSIRYAIPYCGANIAAEHERSAYVFHASDTA